MEYIDDIKRTVERLLRVSQARALETIETLVDGLRTSTAATRVQIQAEYIRDIEAVLSEITNTIVEGTIKPALAARVAEIGRSYGPAAAKEFSGLSQQIAESLAESVRTNLLAVKDVAVVQQSELIAQMMTGAGPDKGAVSKLHKSLANKYESQTLTVMDTNLAGIDRKVNGEVAANLDLNVMEYTGPLDGATRPWCREALTGHSPGLKPGQYYFSDYISMFNDTGPNPASIYGGGWNCRHTWTGIEVL